MHLYAPPGIPCQTLTYALVASVAAHSLQKPASLPSESPPQSRLACCPPHSPQRPSRGGRDCPGRHPGEMYAWVKKTLLEGFQRRKGPTAGPYVGPWPNQQYLLAAAALLAPHIESERRKDLLSLRRRRKTTRPYTTERSW